MIPIKSLTVLMAQTVWMPEVSKIALTYFRQQRSITIASNNHLIWANEIFPLPVVLTEFNNLTNTFHQPASAVILDMPKSNENNILTNLRWNADTKFLIITRNGCSSKLIKTFWEEQICEMIFILVVEKIYICQIEEKSCYTKTPTVIQIELKSDMDIDKLLLKPQVQSCVVNVSIMDFPPLTIIRNDTIVSGVEGSIYHSIVHKLGTKIRYINRHEAEFGTFDPPTGMMGDISTGRSLIGYGSLYPFLERVVKAEMLPLCMDVDVAFAVPSGSGPSRPTSLIILITEFAPIVWLCIGLSYCILVSSFAVLERTSSHQWQWLFYVVALILGVPERIINSRTLMMACIIYGFLLTNTYKTILSSKLTLPPKPSEINTVEALAKAEFRLSGPVSGGTLLNILARDGSQTIIKQLADRFSPTSESAITFLQKMTRNRNSAFMRHKLNIIHSIRQSNDTTGKIHIMEEVIDRFLPSVVMKKGSCFTRDILIRQLHLCEGGFVSKGILDVSDVPDGTSGHPLRKLTVEDFKGSLGIICAGWVLSLLFFVSEFIVYRFKVN